MFNGSHRARASHSQAGLRRDARGGEGDRHAGQRQVRVSFEQTAGQEQQREDETESRGQAEPDSAVAYQGEGKTMPGR